MKGQRWMFSRIFEVELGFEIDEQQCPTRPCRPCRLLAPRGSATLPCTCKGPALCLLHSLTLPFPSLSCSLQAAIALRRCRVCCRLRWLRPCSCCPLLAEPGPRCGHGPPSQPAGQASACSSSPSYGHRCAALRSPWATAAAATPLLAPAGQAKAIASHGRASRPLFFCLIWPPPPADAAAGQSDAATPPVSRVCGLMKKMG